MQCMDGQDNQLKCLCLELSIKVTEIFDSVQKQGEKYISDRLLRSATEVGVRVYQACGGIGTVLFGDRLDSALTYVNEILFLINVLLCRKLIEKDIYCQAEALCLQIQCILRTMLGGVRIVR